MQSFSEAYYQEAAPFILEYIHTIHEEIQKVPDFFLFLYGDPSQGFDSFLRPELLETYDKLFSQAEDAVSGKPEVLNRVNLARLSTHYAILEASRKGVSEEYQLSSEVRTRLEQFKTICESGQITMMNEMRYSVEEYILSYDKALERATLPNKASGKILFNARFQFVQYLLSRPVASFQQVFVALSYHFQHGQGFLQIFVCFDIDKCCLGFTVLSYDHGALVFVQFA